MNIEYEEFASIEDVFLYMSAASPPMKNTMPVNSYKGHVMSFIPIGQGKSDTYLMIYAKGELEPGIYEFDVQGMSYKKVESVERADKNYFILLTPKRNTIADAALAQMDGWPARRRRRGCGRPDARALPGGGSAAADQGQRRR